MTERREQPSTRSTCSSTCGARWPSSGASLDEAEWKAPSRVPGVERAGQPRAHHRARALHPRRPAADARTCPTTCPHVKNDIGRSNERWIESRRSWTGADALGRVPSPPPTRRIAQLRALDDDGFAADSWTPMGPGTVARAARRSASSTRGCTSRTCGGRLERPGDLDSAGRRASAPDDARRAPVRRREEGGGSRRFHRRAHAHRTDRRHRRGGTSPTAAPARSTPPPTTPTVTAHARLRRLRPPRLRAHRPRRGAGGRARWRSTATSSSGGALVRQLNYMF